LFHSFCSLYIIGLIHIHFFCHFFNLFYIFILCVPIINSSFALHFHWPFKPFFHWLLFNFIMILSIQKIVNFQFYFWIMNHYLFFLSFQWNILYCIFLFLNQDLFACITNKIHHSVDFILNCFHCNILHILFISFIIFCTSIFLSTSYSIYYTSIIYSPIYYTYICFIYSIQVVDFLSHCFSILLLFFMLDGTNFGL